MPYARVISIRSLLLALMCCLASLAAWGDDIAQIKSANGPVFIERAGQRLPAQAGARVRVADTIITGAGGSAGVTFVDNSLLSVGPNSVLVIDRFLFNSTTHEGAFDSSLRKGTLSVVSGKIAKQTPEAMKVKTPSSILGARGTEFVVRAGDAAE
ncbi:MAG: FecR domain-containing protein [Burkholderiales bacterium]